MDREKRMHSRCKQGKLFPSGTSEQPNTFNRPTPRVESEHRSWCQSTELISESRKYSYFSPSSSASTCHNFCAKNVWNVAWHQSSRNKLRFTWQYLELSTRIGVGVTTRWFELAKFSKKFTFSIFLSGFRTGCAPPTSLYRSPAGILYHH